MTQNRVASLLVSRHAKLSWQWLSKSRMLLSKMSYKNNKLILNFGTYRRFPYVSYGEDKRGFGMGSGTDPNPKSAFSGASGAQKGVTVPRIPGSRRRDDKSTMRPGGKLSE
ncbi:hypothetical protein CIHG_09934 [Coccidioides immitis H538.4]|uniref:Uncharacterized protein n=1 Tax=Coccidioides immitis H538.4 TaxID=396776 RepID=A0A0J8S5H5_COCIT|nr:hypothetical protein CIHG_09934 [Coccidioides immitis H538.4]